MDELLKLLSENSKFTPHELSLILGEPQDYIEKQIEEYEATEVIKGYRAVVNWEKVPDAGVTALIELKVTPEKEKGFDDIAAHVMSFDEVDSVLLMSGSYDLQVVIKGHSFQEIALFVAKRLSPLDDVLSTATHFVLRTYKKEGRLYQDEEIDERECTVL